MIYFSNVYNLSNYDLIIVHQTIFGKSVIIVVFILAWHSWIGCLLVNKLTVLWNKTVSYKAALGDFMLRGLSHTFAASSNFNSKSEYRCIKIRVLVHYNQRLSDGNFVIRVYTTCMSPELKTSRLKMISCNLFSGYTRRTHASIVLSDQEYNHRQCIKEFKSGLK